MNGISDLARDWSLSTMDVGVVVGVVGGQEDLVPFFVENYLRQNSLPILWVDFGVSARCIRLLKSLGRVLCCSDHRSMGWLRKPFAILQSPFERMIWLDLDIEVKGNLLSYLEMGKSAELMAGEDYCNPPAFRKNLPEEAVLWDTGVLVVKSGCQLIIDWARLIRESNVKRFTGDHEAFSLAVHRSGRPVFCIPHEFHAMRLDPRNLKQDGGKLTFHWTGPQGKNVIRSMSRRGANLIAD